jgi:hypothetical protein
VLTIAFVLVNMPNLSSAAVAQASRRFAPPGIFMPFGCCEHLAAAIPRITEVARDPLTQPLSA